MAQGYLTKLSNYCLCRSAFKCSNCQKKHFSNTYKKSRVETRAPDFRCTAGSQMSLRLNTAGLCRSPSPPEFLCSVGGIKLLITPTCQNDLISCACTCTPGPEKKSLWSPLLPFKHPLPEQRLVAH